MFAGLVFLMRVCVCGYSRGMILHGNCVRAGPAERDRGARGGPDISDHGHHPGAGRHQPLSWVSVTLSPANEGVTSH